MSKGPATFRQRDVSAAIKAAKAAGCTIVRVEVGKDGRVVLVLATHGEKPGLGEKPANEWDEVLK